MKRHKHAGAKNRHCPRCHVPYCEKCYKKDCPHESKPFFSEELCDLFVQGTLHLGLPLNWMLPPSPFPPYFLWRRT